jgi:hypothetical protein
MIWPPRGWLGARLPQARETTATNTAAGARRYFREIGISP